MSLFGGILLYLASVMVLLSAAAIAAGTFLADPEGKPAASAVSSAPSQLVRAKNAKPQKPKEGVQDVAKLHPVAPPASAISVRPTVDRTPKADNRHKRAAPVKRASKTRPAVTRSPSPEPPQAYGYAAPEPRPFLFFPYRR